MTPTEARKVLARGRGQDLNAKALDALLTDHEKVTQAYTHAFILVAAVKRWLDKGENTGTFPAWIAKEIRDFVK